MHFAVKYKPRPNRTAEDRIRTRRLFLAWTPPSGMEIQAHYHYVSGGGVVVVETDDATALFEALEPFKPTTQFDIEPVLNVMDAADISSLVESWVKDVMAGTDPLRPDQAS
jgi:hypothetical protein